ncbi:DUF7736 domain-containing protein [Acinetobacter cumulans]|uniref:DUF7736 domain-containing protein n=1 Tax=Acinetobacter cumulans TaxID=2136182 RepID=UPI001C08249F|nr:hypothetical protein [Acinetobacter cumulans]
MDIQKLTKEQAVIISGFTGILCGEFSDFHADVEKRLGRGVQTFEFGFKEFSAEVKRLYEADFIEMGTVSKEEAKAQAVPEGFVLVSEDQAKDTERLNFLLGGNRYIRTIVQRDIQNEDYEKIGEHHLFTEVYWIDGWDYHENTSSDTERGSIDKAIFHAKEHCHG